MNNIYQKYFGEKDFYDSLAHVLYEIKENRISPQDVRILAEELVKNKMIPEKSNFIREEKTKWNKDYVRYLMNGSGAGRVSKEYLIYYSEVSNYVKKKQYIAISAIIIIGIAIGGIIIFGMKNLNSKSQDNNNSSIRDNLGDREIAIQ